MEANPQINEYFDWQGPASMFANIEKNEDDQFPLKVTKKEKMTHDTYFITLEFPNKEWIAGLWPAGHYIFHADIDGKHVARKYTPVSPINQKGSSDFVIKVYRNCDAFPEGGIFTQWIENSLNVGDNLMCEGPIGMFKYLGYGKIMLKKKELKPKTHVILCAGGSGITPMLSACMSSVLANDGVNMTLVFCNKTKDDILCEKEINDLVPKGANFKVFHTLTRHDDEKHGEWNGMKGRISLDLLKQCGLPEPTDDLFVGSCGPKGFGDTIFGFLEQAGYVKGEQFP